MRIKKPERIVFFIFAVLLLLVAVPLRMVLNTGADHAILLMLSNYSLLPIDAETLPFYAGADQTLFAPVLIFENMANTLAQSTMLSISRQRITVKFVYSEPFATILDESSNEERIVQAQVIRRNGQYFVPVRLVAEALGLYFTYDETALRFPYLQVRDMEAPLLSGSMFNRVFDPLVDTYYTLYLNSIGGTTDTRTTPPATTPPIVIVPAYLFFRPEGGLAAASVLFNALPSDVTVNFLLTASDMEADGTDLRRLVISGHSFLLDAGADMTPAEADRLNGELFRKTRRSVRDVLLPGGETDAAEWIEAGYRPWFSFTEYSAGATASGLIRHVWDDLPDNVVIVLEGATNAAFFQTLSSAYIQWLRVDPAVPHA